MSEHTFPGEKLRARREELGLSLIDVHEATYIPPMSVGFLEEAELDRLPSPCYVAGYLKSYCRLLELDPAPFIYSYRLNVRPEPASFLSRRRSALARRSWMPDLVGWAAICLLIALCWLGYNVVVRPNADAGQRRVTAEELIVPPAPPQGSSE